MPVIQITLVEGRDDTTISECVREVARTVSQSLNAPLSSVRVMVNIIRPEFFAVGDVTKAESTWAKNDK